eukprot:PhF_6_TR21034/c0_g1_i1/m.30259
MAYRRRFSAAPSIMSTTPAPPDSDGEKSNSTIDARTPLTSSTETTTPPHSTPTPPSSSNPHNSSTNGGSHHPETPTTMPTAGSFAHLSRSSSSSRWQRQSMIPTSLSNSSPCAIFLGGPVLLTAPHAKEVWRDGDHSAVKGICGHRLHKRELYTSEVILLLSQSFFRCPPRIGASYIVWNVRAMRCNGEEVASQPDPNYLFETEFERSAWHTALCAFRLRWGGLPLLHIDIHGKKDRKENLHIDIGLSALKMYNEECYRKVKDMLGTQLGAVLRSMPPSKSGKCYGVYFPEDGERGCGFWGHGASSTTPTPHTMAHQANLLGIIGIQIEIPRTLRTLLVHSPALLDQWCTVLQDVYLMLPNSCRTSRDSSPESYKKYSVPTIATCEYSSATTQLMADVAMVGQYDTAKPI